LTVEYFSSLRISHDIEAFTTVAVGLILKPASMKLPESLHWLIGHIGHVSEAAENVCGLHWFALSHLGGTGTLPLPTTAVVVESTNESQHTAKYEKIKSSALLGGRRSCFSRKSSHKTSIEWYPIVSSVFRPTRFIVARTENVLLSHLWRRQLDRQQVFQDREGVDTDPTDHR